MGPAAPMLTVTESVFGDFDFFDRDFPPPRDSGPFFSKRGRTRASASRIQVAGAPTAIMRCTAVGLGDSPSMDGRT